MMKLVNETLTDVIRHEGQRLADISLERCTFQGGGIVTASKDLSHRITIQNVALLECTNYGCGVDGAIVEDVRIENLKGKAGPTFLRANAYQHVTLAGKLSAVEIRGKLGVLDTSHDAEWDRANLDYYNSVDWALDIREARFASFAISGVPTRLIRRDPDTTGVVTRERAEISDWRRMAYNTGLFHIVISSFLEDGYDDVLLVACRASTKFTEQMEDLEMLKNAGVAQ